jgi:hypothetical protein
MKRMLVVIGVLVIIAGLVYARAPKDYQVTGPVLEMDGDHIIVQKGKDEKWELAYDKDTKVTGDLKVGSRVEIKYVMKAVSIEIKGEPKKADPKKK